MFYLLKQVHQLLLNVRKLDFIVPLLLRLYLVPIFWMAGTKKLSSFDSTVDWFGNKDWGLGLPFPELMAFLATWTEVIGAILLLIGLAVSWIAIPLMVTMLVAAMAVHWENGWLAIAEGSGFFSSDRTTQAIEKLDKAKDILQKHGNYDWLTENGSYVILNNGIEFSATYFVMLLALFFTGGGCFISLDYWFLRFLKKK